MRVRDDFSFECLVFVAMAVVVVVSAERADAFERAEVQVGRLVGVHAVSPKKWRLLDVLCGSLAQPASLFDSLFVTRSYSECNQNQRIAEDCSSDPGYADVSGLGLPEEVAGV